MGWFSLLAVLWSPFRLETRAVSSQAGLCLHFGEGRKNRVKEGTPCVGCPVPLGYCVLPGLFLFSSEPWTMAFSKSFKRKFFYNKKTKSSTFELPADAIAPFQ